MALHEQAVGKSNEWYTPPDVFNALGCKFGMDVAHPGYSVVDWIPARSLATVDSLNCVWRGFIWMNPPFGGRNGLVPWLDKFVKHGNGIALVPDRTSASWWQRYVGYMDLVLFVSPKIKFINEFGEEGRSPAQGTSLMAIGTKGCRALRTAKSRGLGVLMIPSP